MTSYTVGICKISFLIIGLIVLKSASADECSSVGGTTDRSKLNAPYFSPSLLRTDSAYRTILEAINDPQKQFYLPRYRVKTENVSGQLHYNISLTPEGTTWVLTIQLERYPDAALGDAARTAQPINNSGNYKIYLTYSPPPSHANIAPRRIEFSEVQVHPMGMQVRLRRDTLPDQDELYNALSNSDYHAQLIISDGSLTIGYKKPWDEAEEDRFWDKLRTFGVHSLVVVPQGGKGGDGHYLRWPNECVHCPRPELDAESKAEKEKMLATVWARNNCRFDSTALQFEEKIPVSLDPRRHAYVYQGIMPSNATSSQGLIRRQVNGRSYYQSEAHPLHFLYLPDKYELKPSGLCSGCPQMTIRATPDHDRFTVDYVATPITYQPRLNVDEGRLLSSYVVARGYPCCNLTYNPLYGEEKDIHFFLKTPAENTRNGWLEEERSKVMNSLIGDIKDTITLNANELKMLFNSVMGESATIFTGSIRVRMPGFLEENIPFEGRIQGPVTDKVKEAIWNQIYKPDIPAKYLRSITVKTSKEIFQGPPNIEVIQVFFKDGDTVTLTENRPEETTVVRASIKDFILDNDVEGVDYHYRLKVDGVERTKEWRSADAGILRLQKTDIQ